MTRVVIIGGGHGQATIARALKDLDDIKLTAIVTVADNGGSTGRLRKHFNIPAMGDIRNVMSAMSSDDSIMNKLMNYRFKGEDIDVCGHSLGNIIITALNDIEGSFGAAISTASKLLKIKGKIIASSLETINIYARMEDGSIIKGETKIPNKEKHIDEIFYNGKVKANPKAIKAIEKADIIIYGIGSLYTSIIPNIIIEDIRKSIEKSKALKIYMMNAMTQENETFDYDLKDHLEALQKHGAKIDLVLKHSEVIPEEIKRRYRLENSIEVIDNNNHDVKVLAFKLLSFDNLIIRHDPKLIRACFKEILCHLAKK